MKSFGKNILAMTLVTLIFTSCGNKTQELSQGSTSPSSNDKEITLSSTDNLSNESNEEELSAYPPSIQIDGTIYQDTGWINSGVTCGTADGTITSTVPVDKLPDKDDQANFGKGYDYQIWDQGYVNVKIDQKWKIFKDINFKSDEIPQGVANFKGQVLDNSDGFLLVQITDLDQAYRHLFADKEISSIKPLSIDLGQAVLGDDVKNLGIENIKNKTIEVYFDGQVENMEDQSSSPIQIGKVYRISLIGE